MSLSTGVVRSNLFHPPAHIRDAWLLATIEEMVYWSFVEYKRLELETNDDHDELVAASMYPVADLAKSNTCFSGFQTGFESLVLAWETISSEFDSIEWTNPSSARYEIFSIVRSMLCHDTLRHDYAFQEVTKMYHIAFDEYLLHHIKLYNVWVQEFSGREHLSSFGEFIRQHLRLDQLSVVGHFRSPDACPANWVMYTPPDGTMSSVFILRHLITYYQQTGDIVSNDEMAAMLHQIKTDSLKAPVACFYPHTMGFTRCGGLSSHDISLIPFNIHHPVFGVNQPCHDLDHIFVFDWEDPDFLVCTECGLVRAESAFDEKELEEAFANSEEVIVIETLAN